MEIARARLRPDKDDDLRVAFDNLPKYVNPSEVVREALRQYFFKNEDRVNDKNYLVPDSVDCDKDEEDEIDIEGNLDRMLDL